MDRIEDRLLRLEAAHLRLARIHRRWRLAGLLVMLGLAGVALTALVPRGVRCPLDAVPVGPACSDKYEASIWQTTDAGLVAKIRNGTVTLADLQVPGAAVQRGVSGDDYGTACSHTAAACKDLYAVSITGVLPSRAMNWFQAAAVARNSGKRLPTNAEWQAAALGTPDGPPCIVGATFPGPTGTPGCVSDVGAFDMVGNLGEWTADWLPPTALNCPGWDDAATYGNDTNCLWGDPLGALTSLDPTAVSRGGSAGGSAAGAGPFAIYKVKVSASSAGVGFRAAR